MSKRPLSIWGWGYADRFPTAEARASTAAQFGGLLGFEIASPDEPVPLDQIKLAPPRFEVGKELAAFCSSERRDRALHTYGKSYPEQLRGYRGDFSGAPDWVAYPRTEDDIVATLKWASNNRVTVVPYGGGTSVVRGVEAEVPTGFTGAISLDMCHFDKVLEVDKTSRAALIQAGTLGPSVESQLSEHGLTLRHFPQSFEFSTVGGWIATRAGGHFATVYTHIDDLVESIRMLTPAGAVESRRLPASGAGPSPDRLMLGSEGVLGVISQAWLRIRPRPTRRATATVNFTDYADAVAAVRAISQSGLFPANCRLLDKREAALTGVSFDGRHVLILGFEGHGHDLAPWMAAALDLARASHGDIVDGPKYTEGEERSGHDGQAGSWRAMFFEAPYLQSMLISMGVIADTFETACTWDQFERLHSAVIKNVRAVMKDVCGGGFIGCRFTHVYPDGPAPYFTFLAPARRGEELEQWAQIKAVASQTLVDNGATITHHHAVGRAHRDGYRQQRPDLFEDALRAVKSSWDPESVLNPGVLFPACEEG